jgi:hypothetical protein
VVGTGSNAMETTTPDNTCLTATDLPKHKAVGMATLHLPYQAMLNSTLRYESGNKAVDSYKHSGTYYYEAVPMSNLPPGMWVEPLISTRERPFRPA